MLQKASLSAPDSNLCADLKESTGRTLPPLILKLTFGNWRVLLRHRTLDRAKNLALLHFPRYMRLRQGTNKETSLQRSPAFGKDPGQQICTEDYE